MHLKSHITLPKKKFVGLVLHSTKDQFWFQNINFLPCQPCVKHSKVNCLYYLSNTSKALANLKLSYSVTMTPTLKQD